METLKLFVKKLALPMTFLLCIAISLSCSSGWSVASYELTPLDTARNTIFIEIMSQDSTQHWYLKSIYNGSNWCHLHSSWEEVRVQ